MTDHAAEISPNVYARVAGLAYIITLLLGIFSVNLVESRLIVPGDYTVTVDNILANALLFRFGIAGEIMMFALVVLLSWALYVILRPVNRNLALLALLWRMGEAIIGAGVAVLSGFIPLLILRNETSFDAPQLKGLVGSFLTLRSAGLDVVLIFIGLGGTVFCYLFFKSEYVPRTLAVWGILTYLSMLTVSLASIILPDFPEVAKMVFYVPGGLFEMIFGFWLLIRGVNIQEWQKHAPESEQT